MNKIFSYLLCFGLCVNCSGEATNNKKVLAKTSQKKESKMPRPSAITTNGHKFWYMPNKDVQVIFVNVLFRNIGAAHQPVDKASLPALYATSVICGAGQCPDMDSLMEKESCLSMSLHTKATLDDVYFLFKVPSIDNQDKNEAIKLFLDVLSDPKFDEKGVTKARNYLQYELTPGGTIPSIQVLIPTLLFKNHPYERSEMGTIENISKISVSDLQNFRKQFLTKNNVDVFIGGDISQKEATDLYEKILARLSKNEIKDVVENVEPNLTGAISRYYTKDSQAIVAFIIKNVPPTSRQRNASRLLLRILGQGCCMNSRIFSTLRSKLGLIYSENIGTYDLKHANYAVGYLCVDNDKVDTVIDETKKILEDLSKNGITGEELEFFKANYRGSVAVDLQRMVDLSRFFFNAMTQDLPVSTLDDIVEGVNSVSLEEANNLAKDLFNHVNFVVLGEEK